MSTLPGFTTINKFSDLEFDKTFDESMQLLNQGLQETYTLTLDEETQFQISKDDVTFKGGSIVNENVKEVEFV